MAISIRYPEFLNITYEATDKATNVSSSSPDDFALTRIGTRTAVFDAFAIWALTHGYTQAVVLGAGMCSRFTGRLRNNGLPPVKVWEVDGEEIIDLKNRSSPTPSGTMRVSHTISTSLPLPALLPDFSPNEPTIFVMEGLLYYLPEESVRALLAACSSAVNDRCCCIASMVSSSSSSDARKPQIQRPGGSLASLFKSSTNTPNEDFKSCGWPFVTTYVLGQAPADTFREYILERKGIQLAPPSQQGKTYYVCAFRDENEYQPFCNQPVPNLGDVVVLGRRLLPNGQISEELKRRVSKGVSLVGKSGTLIFSGGGGEGERRDRVAKRRGEKAVKHATRSNPMLLLASIW